MARIKNKTHSREAKLLTELQSSHGYMLMRVKREADRYISSFKRKPNGKLTYSTRYVVQFAVPMDSMLGKAMVESDKAAKPKKRRAVRK